METHSLPDSQTSPPGQCEGLRDSEGGGVGVRCGTVINNACDQTSQKHIKMPLILDPPFQAPLQINQGRDPSRSAAAKAGGLAGG